MKKATYETRIRMHIDLKLGTGKECESVTMSAAAWNNVAIAYAECSERYRTLNMLCMANRTKQIADQITNILSLRGYYDD